MAKTEAKYIPAIGRRKSATANVGFIITYQF